MSRGREICALCRASDRARDDLATGVTDVVATLAAGDRLRGSLCVGCNHRNVTTAARCAGRGGWRTGKIAKSDAISDSARGALCPGAARAPARVRTLLHLSDLHFGRVDNSLVEPLLAAAQSVGPDLIVISGDF